MKEEKFKKEWHVKDIVSMYESYRAAKEPTTKMWSKIKSFYEGTFWDIFKKNAKEYTLTPDTNYVEYVVSAYVNSIYSAVYVPEITATDLNQAEVAEQLSSFVETKWLSKGIKKNFTVWGENVCLYNMQPVKVYLDKNKKTIEFEDVHPKSIFLDPSVADYMDGEAIFVVKEVNYYSLLKDLRFKDKVKNYLSENHDTIFETTASEIQSQGPDYERFTTTGNKTVSVIEAYIKTETGIDNIFVLNKDIIIYEKNNMIPDRFPIEILYQRQPQGNPYGRPIISKILNSYIALNLLDSIDATQPYMAQNRPKFFDLRSRINVKSFIDYGGTPGSTFPLFGDPSKAVQYQDVQFIPDTSAIKNRIENGIFNITGVDPAYKGRQTNSITTTGGIESQQARVIMLTDNAPLVFLEVFVERLAKLFLVMYKEQLPNIKVYKNNFLKEQVDLSLQNLDLEEFTFILESKPYLPLTKQTRFETLKALYEMQGQYNFQIKLIQEEDLIEELPISAIKKSKLRQRISSAKQSTAALKKRETLLTFASLFQQMQTQGIDDETAASEALKIMDEEEMQQQQDPTLGTNQSAMQAMGGTPMR